MRVEAVGIEYEDLIMNIDNKKVIFRKNIAEVPNELGELMVKEFPYFFPEGKVAVEKEEKVVHVFDETKYQQQEDQIIQLRNSLKVKSQHIGELKAEMADWKRMYEESQERLMAMAPSKIVTKEEVKESDPESDDQGVDEKTEYRNRLEEKDLKELKKIAEKINVPPEAVKRKIAKKDWIDAIIDITFRAE